MKAKTASVIGGSVFAVVTFFTAAEFDSPDVKGSGVEMDSTFVYMLDSARGIAGIPFEINSGYRSASHNKLVGGVSNSAHTKGLAADIKVRNSRDRLIIINALQEVGFTRIGIGKTFIHVDVSKEKADSIIWVY